MFLLCRGYQLHDKSQGAARSIFTEILAAALREEDIMGAVLF